MTTKTETTLAAPRTFERCLRTMLRTGKRDEDYRNFIFPYSGNLTEQKMKAMAELFADYVRPYYGDSPFGHLETQLFMRLKNEWYTGREKDVTLSKDEFGTWQLKTPTSMAFGFPAEHFVVLE